MVSMVRIIAWCFSSITEMAKTTNERSQSLRERRKRLGLVRWECYATPENIAELKKKLAMLKRVDGVVKK